MEKLMISITKPLRKRLEQKKEYTGASFAEIVRRALYSYLDFVEPKDKD